MNRLSSSLPVTPPSRTELAGQPSGATPRLSFETREQTVFIDLQNVTNITSSGIAFFMESMHRISADGGSLVLIGVREEVRRVFETARLDRVFRIFSTREEALASYHDLTVSATNPAHS